jgi:hypothetical protein
MGGRRRPLTPQDVDQLVDGDGFALAEQQRDEQRSLLRPRRSEVDATRLHTQRTEEQEVHAHDCGSALAMR